MSYPCLRLGWGFWSCMVPRRSRHGYPESASSVWSRQGSTVDSMVQRASSETDPAPKQASLSGLRYLSLPYHSHLAVLCLSASAYLHSSSLNTTSFPPFSAICRCPPHTPDSIDRPYKSYQGFPIPPSSTNSEILVSLPSYLHLHITISPQPDTSGLSRLLQSLFPRHICTQSRSDFLLTPFSTTLRSCHHHVRLHPTRVLMRPLPLDRFTMV